MERDELSDLKAITEEKGGPIVFLYAIKASGFYSVVSTTLKFITI